MKIVLLGAPGCGKGTLSQYIIDNYDFIHLSTGNIFRKTMDEKGQYWEDLKSYISKGALVPDDLTNKIVKSTLDSFQSGSSFILDGYPRTVSQADFLGTITDIDTAIFIDVPLDELTKRLTGRRICNHCKKIYNIYYSKPINEGICNDDGEPLIQRKDDQKEVIKNRMDVYRLNTEPLVDYYKKINKLLQLHNLSHEETIDVIDKFMKDNDLGKK